MPAKPRRETAMEAKTHRASAASAGAALTPGLFSALLEPGEPDQILERVLALLAGTLPFDWVGVILREGAGGRLGSAWVREGEPGALSRAPESPDSRAIFDLPVATEEALLPADWAQPLTARLAERGMRRALFLPLQPSRTAGATLLFAQRSAKPFRPRGRALLQTMASPLGRALAAAERERALESSVLHRTREIAALSEMSRAAGTALRYEEMAQVLIGPLHALTDLDLAAVIVDLPGLRDLSLHAPRPVSGAAQSEAAEIARAAFVKLAGRPPADAPIRVRQLDAYEADAPVVSGRFASRESAPLTRRGTVVGAIVVLARREGAFPEARARLLHTIAAQASLTLDRLRTLHEEEETRLQSIIDSMPNGVIMTDLALNVTYTNPAARRTLEALTGAPSPPALDVLGDVSLADVARPVIQEGFPAASAEITLGDPFRIYALTVSPVAAAGPASRTPSGIVLVLSDVTEARLMQEQLLQSEKLSAIGEMISGVAHELNNPLASVMGFAQLLQGAKVPEDVGRKLAIIHAEAQRCQRVVQNLLSFARKHKPERSPVDLNAALSSVLSLLAYQLRVDGIKVTTGFDRRIPYVVGDFHLLQQVFLNLVNNAHQAMREKGGGGTLDVTTGWIDEEEGSGGLPGGCIRVEVRDTGPGISPENLKRIFDPFFTTKKTGEGTGLGLSLAYGAVTEHGGRIYARSQLGRGTTLVVDLPRAVARAEPDRESAPPSPAAAPRSRILVVEDESALAQLLVESLSADGHRIETAANGAEALERIGQHRYDIIISDLKMPSMDGRQLFEEVTRLDPSLARRMIFSTGDVASRGTQDFLKRVQAPLLLKPFDLREVHRMVAELLAKETV
jgi:two-component system NtrC family sensor kinase